MASRLILSTESGLWRLGSSLPTLDWTVEYYNPRVSSLLTVLTSDDYDWNELPVEGVVRVYVFKPGMHYIMILSGVDRYWVKGNKFGQYIVDFDQYPNTLTGKGGASYVWDDNGCRELDSYTPPDYTHILKGTWVPTDHALKMGII